MLTDFFERTKRFVGAVLKRVRSLWRPRTLDSSGTRIAGLDYNVMKKLRAGKMPTLKQIKYAGKFFRLQSDGYLPAPASWL